jgi:hypothetical protein
MVENLERLEFSARFMCVCVCVCVCVCTAGACVGGRASVKFDGR